MSVKKKISYIWDTNQNTVTNKKVFENHALHHVHHYGCPTSIFCMCAGFDQTFSERECIDVFNQQTFLDVNMRDDVKGSTMLYWICIKNWQHMCTTLLSATGIDVNLRSYGDYSPLYVCCFFGYIKLVQMLIVRGADINGANDKGVTPLYIACENKHEKTVQYLISMGCYINITNNEGNTPLHASCLQNNVSIVGILLHMGANVNVFNEYGESPLSISCRAGNTQLVQLLMSHRPTFPRMPDHLSLFKAADSHPILQKWLRKRNKWVRMKYSCEAGFTTWTPLNSVHFPNSFKISARIMTRHFKMGSDIVHIVLSYCSYNWFEDTTADSAFPI